MTCEPTWDYPRGSIVVKEAAMYTENVDIYRYSVVNYCIRKSHDGCTCAYVSLYVWVQPLCMWLAT